MHNGMSENGHSDPLEALTSNYKDELQQLDAKFNVLSSNIEGETRRLRRSRRRSVYAAGGRYSSDEDEDRDEGPGALSPDDDESAYLKMLPKEFLEKQIERYKEALEIEKNVTKMANESRMRLEEELMEAKLQLESERRKVYALKNEKEGLEKYVAQLTEDMEKETCSMKQMKELFEVEAKQLTGRKVDQIKHKVSHSKEAEARAAEKRQAKEKAKEKDREERGYVVSLLKAELERAREESRKKDEMLAKSNKRLEEMFAQIQHLLTEQRVLNNELRAALQSVIKPSTSASSVSSAAATASASATSVSRLRSLVEGEGLIVNKNLDLGASLSPLRPPGSMRFFENAIRGTPAASAGDKRRLSMSSLSLGPSAPSTPSTPSSSSKSLPSSPVPKLSTSRLSTPNPDGLLSSPRLMSPRRGSSSDSPARVVPSTLLLFSSAAEPKGT